MPGYGLSRINQNGKELDEFICGICLGVFRNPVMTQCCRQTYCEECIEEWVSQHKTCPNDRQNLTKKELKPVPRVLINFIDNIKIKCDYESNGCTQVVRIGDLVNHLMVCNFVPNQLCKTCGLVKENILTHNCIQSLICEKQKYENYYQLLNESSSILRIGRENEQETFQEDCLTNNIWGYMFIFGFILIYVILIGIVLIGRFFYNEEYDDSDNLGPLNALQIAGYLALLFTIVSGIIWCVLKTISDNRRM